MIKTLPGIFADVCYVPSMPIIVTLDHDYKTLRYHNALTGIQFDQVTSDYALLFIRIASRNYETRIVAQASVAEHVNKLAIIYDGKVNITPHNCSGQEGAYIQNRGGQFEIYCKIDSWNYIILHEDGVFNTYQTPFPEGTAQGIIDVLYNYPGVLDGTIFWGETRERTVDGLRLIYPCYRGSNNFGQEYSSVDRLVGVENFNQRYLALDNKLGKYPHLAFNPSNSEYLGCWAELNNVIGYEFFPPFPPYVPPVEIPNEEPKPEEREIVNIPFFEKSNHKIDILMAGDPDCPKRLTWLDSLTHPHRNDTNKTAPDVVGILCGVNEDIEEALALSRLLNKPIHLHRDNNEWEEIDEVLAENLEQRGYEIVRSWNFYPRGFNANLSSISRISGKCAPWLRFSRGVISLDPLKFSYSTQELVDYIEDGWNDFRNEPKIITLNLFEWDRGNKGIDGARVNPSLNICYKLLQIAADYKEPITTPSKIIQILSKVFMALRKKTKKGMSKKEGKEK